VNEFTTFGSLLRVLRKRAGMTQGDLAAAAGYSVAYISALETGQRRPDPTTVRNHLAPVLAVAADPRLLERLYVLAGGAAESAPGTLLGRDAEIAALGQRLLRHPGRLLTLTGPPGIGKTSLALAVAQDLAHTQANGVCVVWLGAVADSALVAAAIASALGIVEDERPPHARLIAHLRNRRLLLLLDNFEHVTPAAALVADLLQTCPHLRILVTSRARLRLRAEQSIPVAPLADAAALALFVARVRAQDAGYTLPPEQQPVVAEICRLLDHLPLAIELIAAHALTVPPDTLLALLRDSRLDLLGGRAPDAEPGTLTAALQRSYALLAPAEQQLLRLLGIVDGGAGLDAVAWLGGELRTVQALADKSLVRLDAAGAARRVWLLETVRAFARQLLRECGELELAEQRRLAWCLALAEEAAPLLHCAAQTQMLQRLEPERYNFYAALHYAVGAVAVADAVRIVVALRHFWVARGHLAEIAPWLALLQAEAARTGLDAALWVRLLNCAGTIAFYRGEYAAAGATFRAALQQAEATGDRQGIAYALDGLGAEAANRNLLVAARTYSMDSLAHATAIGEHWLAGITLMNLGEIARMEGDLAAAAQHYRAGMMQLQFSGDPYFIAVAEINLGQVYLHQGELAQAEAVLRQALAAGLQAESVQVVAPALEKLAGVLALRDGATAGRCFGLAQTLRQASGVAVQPVDQEDYARLAAQVDAAPTGVAITVGGRIDWAAIRSLAAF
jgi:predicted ATPase/DNA-binding XRE family transcriptional regulator